MVAYMLSVSPLRSVSRVILNYKRKSPTIFMCTCALCIALLVCAIITLNYTHEVSLDIPALCEINQRVTSLSRRSRSSNTGTDPYIHFSILTLTDGKAIRRYGSSIPTLLESRSLYADLHGYHLVAYFHKPDARRHLVWSKVAAIYDTFFEDWDRSKDVDLDINSSSSNTNNTEHWIWALDVDSLIFNYNLKLESFIEFWTTKALSEKNKTVDFIIARDHNGINAGSFMIRRSQWSKSFLKKWWLRNDKSVPGIRGFYEQAALADLINKDKDVANHVQVVPQRTLNAYGYPSQSWQLFQTGDLVIHFPGTKRKRYLPSYVREWQKMMQDCKLRELWMDAGLRFEHIST